METKPELIKSIVKALRSVHDPEIPVNIYDLGLIYDLEVDEQGVAQVRMTLTAPNCPMADVILAQVLEKVKLVEGVVDANVELVWEPTWEVSMMSEAAKLELEFTGHTTPAHLRKDKFSSLTIGKTSRDRKK
ncbi:MAG: DUF59 domain-containing protein [Planctomycetes bacterium]|nr:DUF59 domain-containing protein [Planctomycetota bacterium]